MFRTYLLAKALFLKEFRGQYRRSWLGPIWALLTPLAYMLIFIFYRLLFGISTGDTPFILFVFTGIILWFLFSGIVNGVGPAFVTNAALLKKMAVPRTVFLAVAVAVPLTNFLISMVVLIGLLIVYGITILWASLLAPFLVLLVILLGLGVGMIVVSVGTYRHDVNHAMPLVLQLWMLMSPIFYPTDIVPDQWRWIFFLNPMASIIESFRMTVIHGTMPPATVLIFPVAIIAIVWLIAVPLFRWTSRYFADVL